ncbi:hypothetical protein MNV49_006449 [Pseudohyphozyma bogoriensis]|nr:hypothetical protein MNV49_006449 [Pseudohyphozyma bogoriensis]
MRECMAAIPTMSLGHEASGYTMEVKLRAAATAGFKGIEASYLLQVPANFRLDPGITGDQDKIVADLQELADVGAKESPPIRFVYEAMCWSTFNYTWQQGWDIVQRVDRPNVGCVLDAFHIGGWEYADPTAPTCERPDAQQRVQKSLNELVKLVPGDRIFYIQLCDAERLDIPLSPLGATEPSSSPYHVEGQQPRMSWSRNC